MSILCRIFGHWLTPLVIIPFHGISFRACRMCNASWTEDVSHGRRTCEVGPAVWVDDLMVDHKAMRELLEKMKDQDWRGNEPWESIQAKRVLSELRAKP